MKRNFVIFTMVAFAIGLMTFTSCKKDDTTSPDITLAGGSVLYINLATTFTEPGFVANDDKDGDITANVTKTGSVNTNMVGLYTLTYTVADKAGNETTVTRDVYVKTAKLAGNYHVIDVVTGANAGTYTYDVTVDSSAAANTWWKTIVIHNFGAYGTPVVVSATIDAGVITIPEQSPSGMPAGYEGKITGTGTYDGANKTLTTFNYHVVYNVGGTTDDGVAIYTKF